MVLSSSLLLAALSATGVPENGFPNWAERTLQVLSNRARADPAAALASCAGSNCPDATCYQPAPPLVWDLNLNHSARFHVDNLTASGSQLQHPSPCLLESGIAQAYPSSCDGSPSCACQGGQSLCTCESCSCDTTQSTCVTQPFDRIALFSPNGCAENIAAGYSDPQATFTGWLTEQCSAWNGSCAAPTASTCSSTTENGHRYNILDPDNQLLGAGSVVDQSDPCYPGEWDSQDFGCGVSPAPTIPKLVAGTHYPQVGLTPTFTANWYDTAAPASAAVDIDGTCTPMTLDQGSGGNESYQVQTTLAAGCHAYVFSFVDTEGSTWLVPEVGAYQAGSTCTADYVATAPAACAGTTSASGTTATGTATTTSGSTTVAASASSSGGSNGAISSSSGGGVTGGTSGTASSSTGVGTGAASVTTGGTGGGASATTGSASAATSGGVVSHPAQRITPSSGCGCLSATSAGDGVPALLLALTALTAGGPRRRLRRAAP